MRHEAAWDFQVLPTDLLFHQEEPTGPEKIHEITVFKTLNIIQQRMVIPEKWKTNKATCMIVPAHYFEFSRSWQREDEESHRKYFYVYAKLGIWTNFSETWYLIFSESKSYKLIYNCIESENYREIYLTQIYVFMFQEEIKPGTWKHLWVVNLETLGLFFPWRYLFTF